MAVVLAMTPGKWRMVLYCQLWSSLARKLHEVMILSPAPILQFPMQLCMTHLRQLKQAIDLKQQLKSDHVGEVEHDPTIMDRDAFTAIQRYYQANETSRHGPVETDLFRYSATLAINAIYTYEADNATNTMLLGPTHESSLKKVHNFLFTQPEGYVCMYSLFVVVPQFQGLAEVMNRTCTSRGLLLAAYENIVDFLTHIDDLKPKYYQRVMTCFDELQKQSFLPDVVPKDSTYQRMASTLQTYKDRNQQMDRYVCLDMQTVAKKLAPNLPQPRIVTGTDSVTAVCTSSAEQLRDAIGAVIDEISHADGAK